jgi:hypothetical protein
LARALALGARGREFESHLPDKILYRWCEVRFETRGRRPNREEKASGRQAARRGCAASTASVVAESHPPTVFFGRVKKPPGAAEAVARRRVTEGNLFRDRAGRNGLDTIICFIAPVAQSHGLCPWDFSGKQKMLPFVAGQEVVSYDHNKYLRP